MKIEPNDPKLTAYALGELDEAESAAIAAQVEASRELQAVVDEIRETGDLLSRELATEPVATLSDEQRDAIEAAAGDGAAPLPLKPTQRRPRMWLIPTSLAASILIVAGTAYVANMATHSPRGSAPASMAARSNIKGSGTSAKLYTGGYEYGGKVPAAASGVEGVDWELDPAMTANAVVLNSAHVSADASSMPVALANDMPTEHISYGYEVPFGPHARVRGDGRALLASEPGPIAYSADVGGVVIHQSPDVVYDYSVPDPSRIYGFNPVGELSNDHPVTIKNRSRDEIQEMIDALPAKYTDADELARAVEAYKTTALEAASRESYDHIAENPFKLVLNAPLSTFSIDVDTASYANVRRMLTQGTWPPAGAVRIEEMINYFNYDYPVPTGDHPFSVNVEVADCPWNAEHRLARIGLKGYEVVEVEDRPVANLVFLIDVSGSMNSYAKLPLVKQGLKMLVDELADDDRIAIVVYAGASGLVLPSTPCHDRIQIHAALNHLSSGGSTNGGAGIELAYRTAEDNFIEGGVNRVILATDGDFNVGTTDQSELIKLIERKAETGVFLSVLGFGMGDYQDSTLEKLADKGNGNYAYIDTLSEAEKVLVEQMGGTLVTIAKDVKIQVEFNPAQAVAYRLVGYENRILAAQDFNDDTKDAGEIGAGHTVTALYEIVPPGVEIDLPDIDPLKYQETTDVGPAEPAEPKEASSELMTVKLRYKEPDGDTSKLIEVPVTDGELSLADASEDFVFAASVASFGMMLRGSEQRGDFTLAAVAEMAGTAIGEDPHGYRSEFLDLVDLALGMNHTGR